MTPYEYYLSFTKYLRAKATLYFKTREEHVHFTGEPSPQALYHPSSQILCGSNKGQRRPWETPFSFKLTQSMAWCGFCTSLQRNAVYYILIFQASSPSCDWYYLYSVLSPVQTTYDTGSPQRKVFRLVGVSLYSIQLQYKLKVLAPGALASIPPVWVPEGHRLQHREVGELNDQKKSKTEKMEERRGHKAKGV